MSIGGSKSSQKSTSTSNSSTQGEGFDYGTGLWSGQAPFLSDLYNRSLGGVNQGEDIGARQQFNRADAVLAGGENSLNMANTAFGQTGTALQRFIAAPGVDPSANAYAQNMGQQFREQFLPGLKGDAMVAGGLGGSRQQIGEALGSQRAMQSIGDFNANIYNEQMNRALQATMGMGQVAQGYQDTGNALQGAAQARLGMSDFSRSMPWYNLNQYSGLLGMPVTLDQGGYNWNDSKTTSTSKGSGGSTGFSFGLK